MSRDEGAGAPRDIAVRRQEISPRQVAERLGRRTEHTTPPPRYPAWASFGSQRQIRALAADAAGGVIWAASWGGVCAYDPQADRCTRYGSAQGLAGNSAAAIALDRDGRAWALAGGRLHCLEGQAWALCAAPPLDGWEARALAAHPEGGVVLALAGPGGAAALARLSGPGARPALRELPALAHRPIEQLSVDAGGAWLGTLWGLYRCPADGAGLYEAAPAQPALAASVSALAAGPWAGTAEGIFALDGAGGPALAAGSPRETILALAADAAGVWAATPREVGRLEGGSWRPRAAPPGRISALLALAGQLWAAGDGGLLRLEGEGWAAPCAPSPEDDLSGAVAALWADESGVWAGGPRGLARYDGAAWQGYPLADLPDVRALSGGDSPGRLWAGGWQGGLRRLQSGVYIPGLPLDLPVVALATAAGQAWAASIDSLRRLAGGGWEEIAPPADEHIGAATIRALAYQASTQTLWVGTSAGLLSYSVRAELWERAPGPAGEAPVEALALDEAGGPLWVGTPEGLIGPGWQLRRPGAVTALALSPPPARELWVGTPEGLERWAIGPAGDLAGQRPRERHRASDSGLAGDRVTALCARRGPGGIEIWAGGAAGVSRYRPAADEGRQP